MLAVAGETDGIEGVLPPLSMLCWDPEEVQW